MTAAVVIPEALLPRVVAARLQGAVVHLAKVPVYHAPQWYRVIVEYPRYFYARGTSGASPEEALTEALDWFESTHTSNA